MTKKVIERDDHYIYFLANKWHDYQIEHEIPEKKVKWIEEVFKELNEVQEYLARFK